ncbi:MAG: hypothetical protein AAF557_15780 [Pseudomonadota bacterium]
MSFMRFSAAPAGRLSDRTIPWAIFGERPDVPDGLEDSALAGASLAQIASTPGAPMFEQESLFGAHMAAQDFDLEDDGPVVVFVHGFQHEPRRPVLPRARSDNPHRCLYHFTETPDGPGSREERSRHITPWFARAMLEDGRGAPHECTGVAVGYSYASWGGSIDAFMPGWWTRFWDWAGPWPRFRQPAAPFLNAYRDAEVAGYGLAAVLTQLRARLDHAGYREKRIDIVCHSLGARTVMSALALIAQRWPHDGTIARLDRILIMGGACYWGQAAYGLANIVFAQADQSPQFFNFTSHSDDVLRHLARRSPDRVAKAEAFEDLSLQGAGAKSLRRTKTLGRDGKPHHTLYEFFGDEFDAWVDIPTDAASTQRWARRQGFKTLGRRKFSLGDHWLHYTHPGNWDLYRAILHDRDRWTVSSLSEALGK